MNLTVLELFQHITRNLSSLNCSFDQSDAYYQCIAAHICLLEKLRSISGVAREKLDILTVEKLTQILSEHALADNLIMAEIQILQVRETIELPVIGDLDKDRLKSYIQQLDVTISIGPKLFFGASYYSQLYKKLNDLFTAIKNVVVKESNIILDDPTPVKRQESSVVKEAPSLRNYHNSAACIAEVQSLISEGILTLKEALVIPKETLTFSWLQETDVAVMSPQQLFRRELCLQYQELELEWELDTYYIELMVALQFKKDRTPQEELKLSYLKSKVNMTKALALHIAELVCKVDKSESEKRELFLLENYCNTEILFVNQQRSAVIKSILLIEENSDIELNTELGRLYGELCFDQMPIDEDLLESPTLKWVTYSIKDPTISYKVIFCDQLMERMNIRLKKLVYFYLLDISHISTTNLHTAQMNDYINSKIEILRIGVLKYFVDKCLRFTDAGLINLLEKLQGMLIRKEFTLNNHQLILNFSNVIDSEYHEATAEPDESLMYKH